jgi:hypothetical protein
MTPEHEYARVSAICLKGIQELGFFHNTNFEKNGQRFRDLDYENLVFAVVNFLSTLGGYVSSLNSLYASIALASRRNIKKLDRSDELDFYWATFLNCLYAQKEKKKLFLHNVNKASKLIRCVRRTNFASELQIYEKSLGRFKDERNSNMHIWSVRRKDLHSVKLFDFVSSVKPKETAISNSMYRFVRSNMCKVMKRILSLVKEDCARFISQLVPEPNLLLSEIEERLALIELNGYKLVIGDAIVTEHSSAAQQGFQVEMDQVPISLTQTKEN